MPVRPKTSAFARAVAVTCAALTACMDPSGGSRPAEWKGKDKDDLPDIVKDPLRWFEPRDIVPAHEAGTLPGELTVSATGKPQYTIPLRVPEGRNQVQPALAIDFAGGASDGVLGVGWRLTGLSRIAPCRATHARDGSPGAVTYGPGDAYCLDGARLVPVGTGPGGTIYRTEEDRMIRVEAQGALAPGEFVVPARFVALHPDGQRWIYSRRVHATQVEHRDPIGKAPEVRDVVWGWALERVEDRLGNAMTFEYDEVAPPAPAGTLPYQDAHALEIYPRRIRYTEHKDGLPARREIELVYEPRPDPVDTYVSGVHVRLAQRLARIEMRAPDPEATQMVWYYELGYETSKSSGRSLLSSVTLCDATKHCLPPTRMHWTHASDAFVSGKTTVKLDDTHRLPNLMPADFDGDGLADVLYWKGTRAYCLCTDAACWDATYGGEPYGDPCPELGTFAVEGEWHIGYSDGNGGFSRTEPTGLRSSFGTREHHVAHAGSSDPDEYNPPIVADFDGDGAADLLAARTGEIRSPRRGYALLQDIGSTFEGLPPFWEPDVRYLADLDGDGRIDLFTNTNRPTPNLQWTPDGQAVNGWSGPDEWHQYTWAYRLGTGEPGFGPKRAPDLTPYMNRHDRDLGFHSVDPRRLGIAMDVDGDGRTELVLPQPGNSYATLEAGYGGDAVVGKVNLTYLWHAVDGVTQTAPFSPVYLDINGDGLRDIVATNGVRLDVTGRMQLPARINTGRGFGPWYLAAVEDYLPPVEQRDPTEIAAGMSSIGDPTAPETQQYPLSPMTDDGVRVFDYNNDGRQDLLVPTEAGPMIYVSDGRRFHRRPAGFELTPPVNWYLPDGHWTFLGWTHQLADLDGDGQADLVQYDQHEDRIVTLRRTGQVPDQLMSVINGLDRVETVVMRPLTDRKVYLPADDCSYPQRCVRGGGQVVSLLQRSNAVGLQDHIFYHYEDGRFDATGNGFLGFSRRTVHHPDLGRRTTFEYDNRTREHGTYPLAGRPVRVRTDQALGDGRVAVETEAHTLVRWWKFGNRVRHVRPTKTVQHSYEIAGAAPDDLSALTPQRTETIDRTWDAYGNLEREERLRRGRVTPEGGGSPVNVVGERRVRVYQWEHREEPWLLGIRRGMRETSWAPPPLGGSETRETRFEPDEHGRSKTIIVEPNDPAARLDTHLAYGAYGQLLEVTRESSPEHPDTGHQKRVESFAYGDERLYPTALIDALGHTSMVQYHPALGVVVRAEDPNGYRTRTTYDAFGRHRWTGHADGFQTWTSYERPVATHYVERVRTSAGAEQATDYNRAGAPFRFTEKAFDGSTIIREQVYDGHGNISERSNAFTDYADRHWTKYQYDGLGRLTRTDYPDGTHTRHAYAGEEQRSWDRRGNESYVRYDVDGNLVVSANVLTDPGAPPLARTTYAYGPFRRVARVVDANGNSRTIGYDLRGRRTSLDDPDLGLRRLGYDAFGDLVFEEDPAGRAAGKPTRYYRDDLGRVYLREALDGSQKYTWDTHWIGKRSGSVSADGIETREHYDELGRLKHQGTFVGGQWFDVEYGYDAASRLTDIRYPEVPDRARFAIRFGFGANGALASISDAATGTHLWRAAARNAAGRTTHAEMGQYLRATRRYDAATGRLEHLEHEAFVPSSSVWQAVHEQSYGYDGNGNLVSRKDPVAKRSETFEYDSLDRLAAWNRQAAGKPWYRSEYRYDPLGNLLEREHSGGGIALLEHYELGATGGGPSALGRYRRLDGPSVVADVTMAYDDNGRRVEGPWKAVEYTSFDLPRRIDGDDGTARFEYTADNLRALEMTPTSTTLRVAQLYELRKTKDGTEHAFLVPADEGVVAQVIHREGEGSKTYYLHRDHLGSASVVTDASGAEVERSWYTPFGDRATSDGLPSFGGASEPGFGDGFTGHRHPRGTGLVDMNGRFYDPMGARFLTPDPFVAHPSFGQSFNRYSYVLNNPLAHTDPSGFVPEWIEEYGMFYEENIPGADGNHADMVFSFPEEAASGDGATDSADDTGPRAPSPGPGQEEGTPSPQVVSRTESMRFDLYLNYLVPTMTEGDEPRVAYRTERHRAGSITIHFEYARHADGRREAWFDPRADVDIEMSPTPVAPRISVDGGVRQIGAMPEIYFSIDIEGQQVSRSSGQTEGRGSPSLQVQVGSDRARATGGMPTATSSETASTSAPRSNSYTVTGRIRIPTYPGMGPQLLRAPRLPRGAGLGYYEPAWPFGPATAGISIVGPTWTVEGTYYQHAAGR